MISAKLEVRKWWFTMLQDYPFHLKSAEVINFCFGRLNWKYPVVHSVEEHHMTLNRKILRGKWILTESVYKILHVQVKGVNNGSPCLILVSSNVLSGQTPSNSPRLEHVDLHSWPKLLSQEKRSCRASNTTPNYCWRRKEHLAHQIPSNMPTNPIKSTVSYFTYEFLKTIN